MEWIEVKIYASSESMEILSGVLMECGINEIQINDMPDMRRFLENNPFNWDYVDDNLMNDCSESCIVFYVSKNAYGEELLISVKDALESLRNNVQEFCIDFGRLELEYENVDDEEWLNNWKKYYKPFRIGKNIIIRPQWEDFESKGETVFSINPGHVFGTGLHQSTRLCIEQLELCINENDRVLDLGCGSGILSIIALLLGAREAVAADLDPNAVDIAYENAGLNHINRDTYHVYSGNILRDADLQNILFSSEYDIVLVNIVADVIIEAVPFISRCIKNGTIIASGIISERYEEVSEVFRKYGFDVEVKNMEEWVCLVCRNFS